MLLIRLGLALRELRLVKLLQRGRGVSRLWLLQRILPHQRALVGCVDNCELSFHLLVLYAWTMEEPRDVANTVKRG